MFHLEFLIIDDYHDQGIKNKLYYPMAHAIVCVYCHEEGNTTINSMPANHFQESDWK